MGDSAGVDSHGDVCLLCRRKFASPEARARHERLSELHQRNLEKQDELVRQHKQEVLSGVAALRQRLQQGGAAGEARGALETQLRQLLGEYGMAQEMLEHSRAARAIPGASNSLSRQPAACAEKQVGKLALDVGAACWQGGKEVQEDRFILDMTLTSADGHVVAGFCVLDGHSGSRCVEDLAEKLPAVLQARLSTKPVLTEEYLSQAVCEACAHLDSDFLERARQHEIMDGSTMILALLFPEVSPRPPRSQGACRLLIANVGDSRAVLCRTASSPAARGRKAARQLGALPLSEDHKPNRPDEQQRIQALGGVVDHHGVWRVFAPSPLSFGGRSIPRMGLAVSRSFGDLLLKEPERYGCTSVQPGGLVTAEPQLHSVEVDQGTDRFLVLACDGVWDVLRNEDAVAVCASQAGAQLAAHSLVRHSFAAGSSDNLTAVVVAWRPV